MRRVVAISGPDGAGKTGVVAHLATHLRAEGHVVRTRHLYGCVVCRRVPRRWSIPTWEDVRGSHTLGRLHAVVDALELAARLLLLVAWAAVGPARVAIADRGPLDGMVKHQTVAGPQARWLYRRLAALCGTTVWLDADPAVLAARDGEHSVAEVAVVHDRFRDVVRGLPDVVRVVATDRSQQDVADEVERLVDVRLRQSGR